MAWWKRHSDRAHESGDASLFLRTETPEGVMPPPRSDVPVTTSTALSLSAVYRSVSILVAGVSQMSLDVWRGSEPITPASWVRRPDMKLSRSAFLEQTVTSLATRGNAYWHVIRDTPAEQPRALVVLDPAEVVIDETARVYGWRGKQLQPWQIQHLALMRIPGQVYGLGPIEAARTEIAGALRTRDFGSTWHDTAGVPTGVLKADGQLSPDDADRWAKAWAESRKVNGTAVLGQGLDYRPILLNPKDAQFIESQQFTVTQVARLFGIPAHMLLAAVEGSSMTYINVADADLTFMRWTLTKYLREIEEAISSLLPRGQEARFNLDAVLRPSTQARYEAHKVALEAGFLTVDEVRSIEGLPPLPKDAAPAATNGPEAANV